MLNWLISINNLFNLKNTKKTHKIRISYTYSLSESFYHPPTMYVSGTSAWPPHLLVFMVSRVTGHPVVPSRMIYSNIISKKHSPLSTIIRYILQSFRNYIFKEICHFYAQGKTIYNANFIQTFVRNDEMR